jgi:hypothetical protein
MFGIKVVEKIETHVLCSVFFFNNYAVCKIMWKSVAEPDRRQMTVWYTRNACWIPKATDTLRTYKECLISSATGAINFFINN